ncbi:MAG: ABC transporter permease [Gemmatimonadales bacterium]|jgi:predicted permease
MERVAFARDLRFSLRSIARRPGFAAIVVLTLAVGIGASTAVFNLAAATLFPRLPVHEPDRLMALFQFHREDGYFSSFSYPTYLDYSERVRTLSGVAAYSSVPLNLMLPGGPRRIAGEVVSGNYFAVLGVRLAVGRGLQPDDGRSPGAQPAVVLSHRLWQSQFGADTALVGSTLSVNGHALTVVGIAPADFRGLELGGPTELWVPLSMRSVAMPTWRDDLFLGRGTHWLSVVGRLAEGVEPEQARAEVTTLAHALAAGYPEQQSGWTARLVPASEAALWPGQRDRLRQFNVVLSTVVGLILLLVCANVANMLVGRVAGRRSEMAVRLALGAGRGRLIRQFVTETLVLTLPAGALGLLVALWVGGLFADYRFTRVLPAGLQLGLDARTISFLIVTTLLVSGLVGLIPAIQGTREDLGSALRVGRAQPGGGSGITMTRSLLSVAQVAGSLVLLACGGLLIRSALGQLSVELGYQPEHVALLAVDLDLSGYTEQTGSVFYGEVLERIEDVPGVSSASAAAVVPLARRRIGTDVSAAGGDDVAREPRQLSGNVVATGYFKTMGIPLVRGRDFDSRDANSATAAVIVSQSAAQLFWPDADPIGERLALSGFGGSAEVVGVARDARMERGLFAAPGPFFYLPLSRVYQPRVTLHVRSAATDPEALVPAVRAAVASVDPHVPTYDVRTLKDHVRLAVAPALNTAAYVASLGLLGVILAAVGIYGVISYSVIQRTHEIGIRMTLGAEPQAVLVFMLSQGLKMAALGVAIGLAAGLAVARLLDGLLYEVGSADPLTFAAAAGLTAAVSFVAVLLPAWRAARVDPLLALRAE